MRLQPSVCLVLSFLAFLCPCDSSEAQQLSSSQSAPTLKTQAPEVLLPVMVIDKKGALVKGLTASDVTLTQDGRPQAIKSFTTDSNLPFQLGLLIDTSRTVYGAMDSERKAAEKFLELMLPADPTTDTRGNEAFLIHFDREVELLEDFTNSRDKLVREINEMGPTSPEKDDPQGPETTGDDRQYGQTQSSRNAKQLYDAIYLASNDLMKSKKGRKALIVFSDGADHGSKETINDAIDAADRANLEVCTIYYKGEQRRQEQGLPGQRRGGLGGNYPGGYPGGWPGGGGGYPGDGSGRRSPTSEAGVDGKKIMQQIAERTGGMFFEAKRKEDLANIYSLIAAGLQQQYILTYTPDREDNDGEFHRIAVKANNKDYTVEVREGYYSPSSDK
jgi:VWFA-related protein